MIDSATTTTSSIAKTASTVAGGNCNPSASPLSLPINPPVPLKSLKSGQRAIVNSLIGSPHDVARLSEMGLRRGTEVSVIRNGITCILQLDGNRLCIRLSHDLMVLVVVQ